MVVTHLGLENKDIAIIKSAFNVSKELRENYTLVGTEEKLSTLERLAGIVLINSDDEEAIKAWRILGSVAKNTAAVMVTAAKRDIEAQYVLRHPLTPKRIAAVLDVVTREKQAG